MVVLIDLTCLQELAVDLCLSSMLGENVYNFGEILSHPVVRSLGSFSFWRRDDGRQMSTHAQIESLRGTRFEWLIEVVDAFNRGDLNQYDRLCNKYADQLNSQPALVANERKLREKITVTALLEIIFRRAWFSSFQRTKKGFSNRRMTSLPTQLASRRADNVATDDRGEDQSTGGGR